MNKIISTALLLGCLLNIAVADNYSPHVGDNYPRHLYWGDTHLHTSFSLDANTMGNTGLAPASAYRFALGEEVVANNGMPVRLEAPLDFLVVSDHAEHMGIMLKLRASDPAILDDPDGHRLYSILNGDNGSQALMMELLNSTSNNTPMIDNEEIERSVWLESVRLADEYNKPGHFTALIGYEWSSMPAGDNLHRVVVFADGAEKTGTVLPFSSFDSEQPEQLWQFLADYEDSTGGRALAIPHNGNISNGRMYALTDSSGQSFSEEYAKNRIRWEPIMEVTQIKGDGETHPYLSPQDPYADFETWDFGNFGAMEGDNKEQPMLKFEYARSTLKNGLLEQQRISANPYKFGMIGSTDSHTSLATAQEDNFWGKASMVEPGSSRTAQADAIMGNNQNSHAMFFPWEYAASGYAAVWARDNTRADIFDAMQRKEVYATTGSRIALRFFGGWDFQEDDIFAPDYASLGYAKGVPMGADLPEQTARIPAFLVMALKDPNGANLDRVQIVKGWLDKRGELHEKVYDVAEADRGGRFRKTPSTVNEQSARYGNSIGEPQLGAYWQDPDFNANEQSFYYVRVIEIPTPRWPAYDRARLGVQVAPEAQLSVQDRAYSSPIWYTP